jgi:hypothetical protein
MNRRLLAAALGAAAAAALVAARRRPWAGAAPTDGGSSGRTDRLRSEIEAAREQLREDLARMRRE